MIGRLTSPLRISLLFALTAAVLACAAAGSARAATWGPCGFTIEQVECATFNLPIDRTGGTSGDTNVRAIKVEATEGPRLGTLFVIAGGPGQPSNMMLEYMLTLFSGANRYDLVAIDQRGTGFSEPLNCPTIELTLMTAGVNPKLDSFIGQCATALGAARAGYDTAESVEDMEAVRADLGIDQISLFGVSYGTKLAMAYAKAHPGRVRSVLLDSVLPVNEPSTFDTTSAEALRLAFDELCERNRCAGALRSPPSQLNKLVKRLAVEPIEGELTSSSDIPVEVKIGPNELYELVYSADFDLYIYEQLPAAFEAALHYRNEPLLRLFAIVSGESGSKLDRVYSHRSRGRGKHRRARARGATKRTGVRASDVSAFSNTLFLATTCEDFAPPWPRGSATGSRQAAIDAAADALPDSAFYPFDRKILKDNSQATFCRNWQESADTPALVGGSLPDVPVLALSGSLDLRTPISWARTALDGAPRGQLVVVPHTGHSTIGTDISGCALSLAKRFLVFGGTDGKCNHNPGRVPVAPRAVATINQIKPLSGRCRNLRGRRCGGAKRTVTAAYLAFRDALDQLVVGGMIKGPGLYGGSWTLDDTFDEESDSPEADSQFFVKLDAMEQVPGVFTDGSVDVTSYPRVSGSITVSGPNGYYRINLSGRMGVELRNDVVRIHARSRNKRVSLSHGARNSAGFARTTVAILRARSAFARRTGTRRVIR